MEHRFRTRIGTRCLINKPPVLLYVFSEHSNSEFVGSISDLSLKLDTLSLEEIKNYKVPH